MVIIGDRLHLQIGGGSYNGGMMKANGKSGDDKKMMVTTGH